MRWERLFADLEGQWAAAGDAEFAAEVADRARSEMARTLLVDRLRAARGVRLRVEVLGGTAAEGVVRAVGTDWLLVADAEVPGAEALVLLAAVTGIRGLGRPGTLPAASRSVAAALGLPYVLRQIARDRDAVSCALIDGSTVVGTLDRVGADHLELAEHPGADARRAREVAGVRLIPITALTCVRRRLPGPPGR